MFSACDTTVIVKSVLKMISFLHINYNNAVMC